ncbi:hypothetical protein ACHAO9_005757 [Fusarium lateritium]
MGVNLEEIQPVTLDFFIGWFTVGNIKNATRLSPHTHVVWGYDAVSLCSWTEVVFRTKPTRLFLHAYVKGDEKIELLLFSRLGTWRTGNLFAEQLTLEQLHVYYYKMSDIQFGLHPLIHTDQSGNEWIFVKGREGKLESCMSDSPRTYKLRLDKDPTVYPREIVGNRPTCYRATDDSGKEFAVKFSPKRDQSLLEAKLLRRAVERRVWGVVQLIDFRTVEVGTTTSSCMVTFPFARDLEDYHSTAELMQCFRDAIKGHYNLYKYGKILHRDVSVGNIMITNYDKNNPDAPRGILIDLDGSLDLKIEQKKPYNLQGTKAFMAIDISRPPHDHILHTYRHDLESFFYVFLYLAVCRDKRLPKTSRLMRWMDGKKNWVEVGSMKREDMSDDAKFTAIVGEFGPSFKDFEGLANELRRILFYPDDEFFVGTKTEKKDINKLYHGLIDAFAWAGRLHINGIRWRDMPLRIS